MAIKETQKKLMERWAAGITRWIGSTTSVLLHTILFLVSFILPRTGIVSFERMLLVLTTIVSLEAIYLSIFIQMSLNQNNQSIEEIQQDIEEIGEDIEEIQKDVDEIQEDVVEIQEDVVEIQEDVTEDQNNEKKEAEILLSIQATLLHLQKEIEQLKSSGK